MQIKLKIGLLLAFLVYGLLGSFTMAEDNSIALESIIALSPDSETRLQNTVLIGDFFLESSDEGEARKYYVRALNEYEDTKESPNYIVGLMKLANVAEDHAAAREYLIEAKDLAKLDKKNEQIYANVLVSLIWTYDFDSKNIPMITTFLEEAIKIKKKYTYSTDYTATLRVLAWTYETRNLLSQAEYYYSYALNEDLQYLGFSDIRTVLAMENMAQFYIDFNQLAKAKQVLEDKYKLHMEDPDKDYYNLARTESMLGWVTLNLGEADQAEEYYLQALKDINLSVTKSADQLHYFSLPALFDLISFYIYQNNIDEAVKYFKDAENILMNTEGLSIQEYSGALAQGSFEDFTSSYKWAALAHYNSLRGIQEYINKHNTNPE